MEYDHGVRVTPLPHEMSPLDRAISDYMAQAEQYHKDKAKTFCNEDERIANDKKLAECKAFLKNRRRSIRSQAQVQERLDDYRKAARDESSNDWTFEEITARSTRKLISFMEVTGEVKPASNCQAHHIIPVVGKKTAAQVDARMALHESGVGINDPQNGVWLPSEIGDVPHYLPTLKDAMPHAPLHTKAYEGWVFQKMAAAYNELSARTALGNMRRTILKGLHDQSLVKTLTNESRKRLGV